MIPEKWVWRHIHSFIHSKIFFHSKARCHEKRMAFLTYVWSANWFYIFKILQQRATNFSKWHPNFKIRWHLLRHACQLASVQSILFKNVKCRVLRKTFFLHCLVSLLRTARLWIRIRMDPHSFSLLDPDPGDNNLRKRTGQMQENCSKCNSTKTISVICTS